MKRGFLNKPPRKASLVQPVSSSNNQSDKSTGGTSGVADHGTAKHTKKAAKTEQPMQAVSAQDGEKAPPKKAELENLTFVTIPPRRLNQPDDPDGHAELVVPAYGNALSKVRNAPGYPKPVAKPRQKNYIIKSTDNMGLAMFATRDLKKGELLLAERPFLCTPEAVMSRTVFDESLIRDLPHNEAIKLMRSLSEKRLEHMVARMSEADREGIMQLANSHENEEDSGPVTGRLRTNCYGIKVKLWDDVHGNVPDGKGGTMKMGYMFLGRDASRINHSCMPNVMYLFDLPSFSIQFFAGRPIKSGEQIFHCYAEQRDPLAVRRAYLEPYGVVCTCYACTHSSPESEAFRRDFPDKIQALINACNDMIGGLPVLGRDGIAKPPGPRKPFDPNIQPKLKKEILEPSLRLQADIEREGLSFYKETTALWMVLSRTWAAIPGEYAAKMSQKAYNGMETQIKLYGQL